MFYLKYCQIIEEMEKKYQRNKLIFKRVIKTYNPHSRWAKLNIEIILITIELNPRQSLVKGERSFRYQFNA